MSISKIALAVPLVLGIGCSTMGRHVSSDKTGAMWTDGAMQGDPRDEDTAASADGAGPSGPQIVLTAQQGGSPSGADSSGSAGAPGSSDSTGSDSATTSSADGSEGMGSGSAGDQAQADAASGSGDLAQPEEHIVQGKLSRVAKGLVSITPKGGSAKILRLSPDTLVTINGRDGKVSQLKRGQVVLASYSSQGGDDVALKIDVASRQARLKRQGTPGSASGGTTSPDAGSGSR